MIRLTPAVESSIEPAAPSEGVGEGGAAAHLFLGAGDGLVRWFYWTVDPAIAVSARVGITPDHYSYLSLALGLISAALLAAGQLELGGTALALSGLADVLDGRLARATGQASRRGDFIDSTFDRFVDVVIFLGLVYYLRTTGCGSLAAAAAMGASLLVSYSRARGEVHGVRCAGGLMQRQERVLLLSMACLLDPTLSSWAGTPTGTIVLWTLAVIAVATVLTAIYRTMWIAAHLRRAGRAAAPAEQRAGPRATTINGGQPAPLER